MIVLLYGYNVIALGECFRRAFAELGDVVCVGPADNTGPNAHDIVTPGPYVPWSVLERVERERGPIEAVVQIEGGQPCILTDVRAESQFPIAYYSADAALHPKSSIRTHRRFDYGFNAHPHWAPLTLDASGRPSTVVPFGGDPRIKMPEGVKKEYDVVFVGHRNPDRWPKRAALLDRISKRYNTLITAVPREQAVELYAKGTLVFNCGIIGVTNMRVFEVLSSGACLLTDRVKDDVLNKLFVDGEHYLGYDEDDLEQVIDRYLADPDECARIGKSGQAELLRAHTWTHRAAQIRDTLRALRAECGSFRRPVGPWNIARYENQARTIYYRAKKQIRSRIVRA